MEATSAEKNMPETSINTQSDNKNQHPPELMTAAPTALLRFRRPLILLAHIIAFAASLMLSFLVVQNMQLRREWLQLYPLLLLFFLIVKLPIFGLFKQYRTWWRYVGISDLRSMLLASLTSTSIIVVVWFAAGWSNAIRMDFRLPELLCLGGKNSGLTPCDESFVVKPSASASRTTTSRPSSSHSSRSNTAR